MTAYKKYKKFLLSFIVIVTFIITLAIFLFLPRVIFAQVVINEFFSSTTSDWIEFYNTGTESAQLSGLRVRDSTTNKKNLSGELAPGGFLIVTFSNWLNNEGDVVKLVKIIGENEELIEEIPYGIAGGLCSSGTDGSIGRFPDGSATIVRFIQHTQGASNNTAQEDPCPTPTPTPTLTPTPVPTAMSTPKPPTPTPTPKSPTPTPKSSSTPTPTSNLSSTSTPKPVKIAATLSGEILGEEQSTSGAFYPWEATEGAEFNQESTPSSKNKLPAAIFLGVGFSLLFATAFWVWYTKIR